MTKFTRKQKEVLLNIVKSDPQITVLSGAKRAGKTYILNVIVLMHIAKFTGQHVRFILGGVSQSAIRRNVLDDWETILGKQIVLDKTNSFTVFGVKVTCFNGEDASSYKQVRGFTACGCFLNEATALHETFVRECLDRSSMEMARIFMDTNPENPSHYVKKEFIDNAGSRLTSGRLNIYSETFTIFDNDTLSDDYIERQIATKSGMFLERDIYGRWVSPDGVIYPDFNDDNYIEFSDIPFDKVDDYYVGVDWGYEHYGSMVLMCDDTDGNTYLLQEIAERHQKIDWWVEKAKMWQKQYGEDLPFYVDSARPDYYNTFMDEDLLTYKARKDILAGIGSVSGVIKENRLKVVRSGVKRFNDEVYQYVWAKNGKDEPQQEYDDVMDSLRYAYYTHHYNRIVEFYET